MSDVGLAEYYRERERQHRGLAKAAISFHIAGIHNKMADRYLELSQLSDPRPPLRLILSV